MFIYVFQVYKLQAKGWHSVMLCYRESGKKVTLKQMMFEDPKLETKFKQQNGLSRLKGLARIFYKSKWSSEFLLQLCI